MMGSDGAELERLLEDKTLKVTPEKKPRLSLEPSIRNDKSPTKSSLIGRGYVSPYKSPIQKPRSKNSSPVSMKSPAAKLNKNTSIPLIPVL